MTTRKRSSWTCEIKKRVDDCLPHMNGTYYVITCDNRNLWNDNPIRVADGRILYDFPERIPAYAKRLTVRAFRWIDQQTKEDKLHMPNLRVIPHINSMGDLMRLNANAGYFYFSADTMRYFNSHIDGVIFKAADGTKIYFCTSEKAPHAKRAWTVRAFDVATADINTFGEFQAYNTLLQARKAAAAAAQ